MRASQQSFQKQKGKILPARKSINPYQGQKINRWFTYNTRYNLQPCLRNSFYDKSIDSSYIYIQTYFNLRETLLSTINYCVHQTKCQNIFFYSKKFSMIGIDKWHFHLSSFSRESHTTKKKKKKKTKTRRASKKILGFVWGRCAHKFTQLS